MILNYIQKAVRLSSLQAMCQILKKSENCAEIVPTFLLRFEAKKPEFCTGSYLVSLLTMNSEFSLQMESPVSQSNLQHDSQVHLRG